MASSAYYTRRVVSWFFTSLFGGVLLIFYFSVLSVWGSALHHMHVVIEYSWGKDLWGFVGAKLETILNCLTSSSNEDSWTRIAFLAFSTFFLCEKKTHVLQLCWRVFSEDSSTDPFQMNYSLFNNMHTRLELCVLTTSVFVPEKKSKQRTKREESTEYYTKHFYTQHIVPLKILVFFFELMPDRKFKELLFCFFFEIFSTSTSSKIKACS